MNEYMPEEIKLMRDFIQVLHFILEIQVNFALYSTFFSLLLLFPASDSKH